MFSFVYALVEQVLKKIFEQMNIMGEILEQITGLLPGVDAAWTGPDATAFVEDVSGRLQPQLNQAMASTGGMYNSISRAVEVVLSADQKASTIVRELDEQLKGIAQNL